jgi:multiple RNA-binding domain-containing protein 1
MKSKTWANDGVNVPLSPSPESRDPIPMDPSHDTIDLLLKNKRSKADRRAEAASHLEKSHSSEMNKDSKQEGGSLHRLAQESKPVVENDPTEVAEEAPADSPAIQDESKTDTDWLRSKTSRLLDLIDDNEQNEFTAPAPLPGAPDGENSDTDADVDDTIKELSESKSRMESEKPPGDQGIDANIDMIRNTGRLFIRNLPYNASETDLEPLFARLGKLEEVSDTIFSFSVPLLIHQLCFI